MNLFPDRPKFGLSKAQQDIVAEFLSLATTDAQRQIVRDVAAELGATEDDFEFAEALGQEPMAEPLMPPFGKVGRVAAQAAESFAPAALSGRQAVAGALPRASTTSSGSVYAKGATGTTKPAGLGVKAPRATTGDVESTRLGRGAGRKTTGPQREDVRFETPKPTKEDPLGLRKPQKRIILGPSAQSPVTSGINASVQPSSGVVHRLPTPQVPATVMAAHGARVPAGPPPAQLPATASPRPNLVPKVQALSTPGQAVARSVAESSATMRMGREVSGRMFGRGTQFFDEAGRAFEVIKKPFKGQFQARSLETNKVESFSAFENYHALRSVPTQP